MSKAKFFANEVSKLSLGFALSLALCIAIAFLSTSGAQDSQASLDSKAKLHADGEDLILPASGESEVSWDRSLDSASHQKLRQSWIWHRFERHLFQARELVR